MRFLDAKSPETAVREQMETEQGYDEAVWKQMAEQLGLQGLHVPEEYGGSGYAYVELGVVLEEMGRVAAVRAVLLDRRARRQHADPRPATTRPRPSYLPGIADGETIATLAFTEPSGQWDESGITLAATTAGDGCTLTGTKMFVLDGHTADLILVAARTDAGVSLFAVDGDAAGPDPHRAVHHGPDPQAGQARASTTRRPR